MKIGQLTSIDVKSGNPAWQPVEGLWPTDELRKTAFNYAVLLLATNGGFYYCRPDADATRTATVYKLVAFDQHSAFTQVSAIAAAAAAAAATSNRNCFNVCDAKPRKWAFEIAWFGTLKWGIVCNIMDYENIYMQKIINRRDIVETSSFAVGWINTASLDICS